MRILLLALVATPVIGFSIGCMLPGCGDGPSAPSEVLFQATVWSPRASGADTGAPGDSGDTAAPDEIPSACDDRQPALALGPLGEEVWFQYGSGCGDDPDLYIDVVAEGILPGEIEAAWTLSIDGEEPIEGGTTWRMSCEEDGTLDGYVTLALPTRHDGKAVTLDLLLVDAAGTEVSATTTFIARVTEG